MESLTTIYDLWYRLIRDNTSVSQWALAGLVIFTIMAFLFLRDKLKNSSVEIKFGNEAFLECFGGAFGLTMIILVLAWALPVTITILCIAIVLYAIYHVMFKLAKLSIRG